ncbi:helix-turn-helix transcriptional regulator [Paenibacillus aceti]|uniref:HTH luxR-type domain-containing protein n=1 Tax=Paenibacillus aceti TaxID=1820010 RepID=A0ABQ1W2D6_9BACL|nr:LuxR C-terminal-related transcriptional regulator [Paenibacillus aceti]GGG11459.1 hypothetical protein GCM10010913_36610 [Paenibacillus aceti]
MKRTGVQIIERTSIDKEMSNLFLYPLTVVHSPMGYGKTTEVRRFLQAHEVRTLWITLIESGSEEVYFWQRLCSQVMKYDELLGRQLEDLGFPQEILAFAKIIDIAMNHEFVSPVVIVIDDYHLVENKDLYHLIRLIAQEWIPNLHIVVITRELGHFDLSLFYEKRVAYLIDKAVLSFNRQEIQQFFREMGYELREDEIDAINELSGGWISMIYLILQSLKHGGTISRNSSIDELIQWNLYNELDEPVKRVLLQLSCLDHFTYAMVLHVLDEPNLPSIWKELLSENVFITFNDFTSNSYRIQNLLRDFLGEQARLAGLDLHDIRVRAGEWHMVGKDAVSAFPYFYQAGEIERILEALNQENMPYLYFTQFRLIIDLFHRLEDEHWRKYPLAYLQYLRFYALSGEAAARKHCAEQLRRMESYFKERHTHANADADSEYASRILGEINMIWVFVVFNDIEKVVYHNLKAHEYFEGGCSQIVTKRREFTMGSPHLLYAYYREQGKLRETAEYIKDHFQVLYANADGCGTGSDVVAMTEYALETGDFEHVELYAYRAFYIAQSEHQLNVTICAKFAFARYLIYSRRIEECQRLCETLENEVLRENNPILNTTFELCKAYIDVCLQRDDSIPHWINEGNMALATFPYQGLAFHYIVFGKIMLLRGEYLKLDALCEAFARHFSQYQNQLGFIHNYIHQAIARDHLQGRRASKEILYKALVIGEADHIMMPFVENAAHLLPLLRDILKDGIINKAYLNRMITHGEAYCHNLSDAQITLSKREIEVLQLLSEGNKYIEISQKLYISVATVRYHVKNIYTKLGSNNRVMAIEKAKQLNMI